MFADYLIDQAHQYTQNVQTYSIGNSLDSTLKPAQITYLKVLLKLKLKSMVKDAIIKLIHLVMV